MPDNDLFAPKDGETSTAGLNLGSAEATSTGIGSDDGTGSGLGATLGSASGLGSDEGARTIAGTGGTSALGSDPFDIGTRTADGAIPANTVGGQSLLMENDNATTNSNVGSDASENSGGGI